MNTTTVAKKLGVSTKRIHKWIKHFNLSCKKNENGHYFFDDANFALLSTICEQMKQGVPLTEMKISLPRKGIQNAVTSPITDEQYTRLLERIERNERKIEEKASEVVSYQLLQQRREIEELNEKISKLEKQVQALGQEREGRKDIPLILDEGPRKVKKPAKRRSIVSLFL
ncbi:MerR family transcriptional regulator [Bacillus luteolus]|uniref:MerR family transcriptional regulator n=1 Tax=Litchfieldia luteola TaxID=682179 RepID=A0ABR9QGZ7_9BACI|nr:MerR family transcriptional regulator [Cytobacillus luteolus]MBE4907753.1 MerR family transcriptional regulator [Cytobacillus luteolus]MBP1944101.1 chromosome-anchoring protein RacA [Cytobacillus luteolus]